MLKVRSFTVGPLLTNCYFISRQQTGDTIIVDPGADGDFLSEQINNFNLSLKLIFFTHAHYDHLGGALPLLLNFAPVIFLPQKDLPLYRLLPKMPWFNQQGGDPFVPVSCLMSNPQQCQNYLHQCGFQAKLLAFPGHTPGQTALYFPQENYLFAGDFIFAHTTGRTDLPDANAAAMQTSLKRLQKLPPQTRVYPGHEDNFLLQTCSLYQQ